MADETFCQVSCGRLVWIVYHVPYVGADEMVGGCDILSSVVRKRW